MPSKARVKGARRMFKSKVLNIVLLTMACLTIVAVISFYYLNHKAESASKPPTIDDIAKNLSVETEEMTTNLADDKYIRIKFTIQVSNKEAKDELEKRQFQVKNTILYLLSNMTEKNLRGQAGLKQLESSLQQKLNALMTKGEVVHVYTTEKIIE
jgi:flagellar FliL protein